MEDPTTYEMCDYWISSNVVPTDSRVDADPHVPLYHDVLYYKYPAMGLFDKPVIPGKCVSEDYIVGGMDYPPPHDGVEYTHPLYNTPADFTKPGSGISWDPADSYSYDGSPGAVIYPTENHYIDGISASIGNELRQAVHRLAAHSLKGGEGAREQHPNKIEVEQQQGFRGYHPCDVTGIPAHQGFMGDQRVLPLILGNFAPGGYVPATHQPDQMHVGLQGSPEEGCFPFSDFPLIFVLCDPPLCQ